MKKLLLSSFLIYVLFTDLFAKTCETKRQAVDYLVDSQIVLTTIMINE